MKKLITLAGSVALFAATIVPAIATGNNCSNGTTGPFATNYCTINNTSNVDVDNVNDAQITNNVTARTNTGGNTASYNTLGGAIHTGNSTLNATISNVANVNTTTVSGDPAASGNTGVNEITGPESDNRVNINNDRLVDVWNSNTATVTNEVSVESNTGENAADYNTGPASIDTGTAWLRSTVANHVNDNATGISAGAGGTGGNTASNSTTGPFSTDYVTVNNTSDIDVDNVNDLIVGNWVEALANSGRNSTSYTTLGGVIDTGVAGANVGVNTEGNINTTTIQMAMGGFANNAGNEITGPYSDNREELLNSQEVEVENWNNKCRSHNADRLEGLDELLTQTESNGECDVADLGVFNYDSDEVNTGENAADYNTLGGGVVSGMSDLVKSILTHLNDTLTVIEQ